VGRGLLPLARVESAVEKRAPGDLSPLSVEEPVEIMSLIKALNRLFKQLDRDIEMQKRFTSNAAHQLRTPLAVLGTYSDLAMKMVKNGVKESEVKEVQEVLTELDGGINRMSKLVSRLLVLARSEPGVASVQQCSLINLSDVASQVTAANVPESIKKKIELEFYAPSEPALIWGNQGNIEELIGNLIENSVLYSNAGGRISVRIDLVNGRSSLIVQDDGPGIAAVEREKVFERFYRVAGTEQAGTGLGLAIVKEVAASHNADVTISDGQNGIGTSIKVSFPTVP
jgi:signal transduction histidine kinase